MKKILKVLISEMIRLIPAIIFSYIHLNLLFLNKIKFLRCDTRNNLPV